MKYFIDTEFIDGDHVIDLISLGVVAEDGREFYAISTEFEPANANTFVRTVVIPQLEPPGHPAWMSRAEMKDRLVEFVGTDEPRFWSYAGAPWDWMAMAQLFPVAERVPDGWLYTAYDVLLLIETAGVRLDDPRLPPPPPDVHHALGDARWASDLHRAATRLLPRQPPEGLETGSSAAGCTAAAEVAEGAGDPDEPDSREDDADNLTR